MAKVEGSKPKDAPKRKKKSEKPDKGNSASSSTANSSADKPKPTRTQTSRPNRNQPTGYRPNGGQSGKPDKQEKLSQALRENQRAQAEARKIEREAAQRGAQPTSNDGRSDNLVQNTTPGTRNSEINATRRQRQAAAAEATELAQEVKSDEKKTGIFGTVLKLASPALSVADAVTGGKVGNAVTTTAANVLFEAKDDRAAATTAQSTTHSLSVKIGQQVTLNAIAETGTATGMPDAVVRVIDGRSALDVKIVDSSLLPSDAQHNSATDDISVSDTLIEDRYKDVKRLQAQGVLDKNGNVVNATKLDASKAGDELITAGTLIGVHEPTHAAQNSRGAIEAAASESQRIIDEAIKASKRSGLSAAERTEIVAAGMKQAELHEIDKLEYEAYLNDETVALRAGKLKRTFLTINADGTLIDRATAVQNIYAYIAPHDHAHAAEASDGRRSSGDDTDGRRSSGDDTDGRRSSGEASDGRRSSGDETDGRRSSGEASDGRRSSGEASDGRRSSGDTTDGRRSSGDATD